MSKNSHSSDGGFFTGDEAAARAYGVAPKAFLITGAPESFEQQQRARIRKYSILMSIRIPALILAALAYMATDNGLIALAIIAISIPLPWIAVLIANDRPPRQKGEMSEYLARREARAQQRALQEKNHETIDG
ncbi:DUF3099 domain-containing protein [Hoyosella rhizosphaerae]|uniref:DUF3099 domain-containing protein n=1 Tax=Hoyosella rhizosphaerae TaxID=1755582 RepID=A0A916U4P4_9ACTN|nr:DUF3099 domain-containing protein [Hoyosella rhizosphaerae]MBN4926375.1 DUF3099 domain-containing protein [Hoyosella rhizosphaerae]GGC59886.1 hypothetical protein GCM10011410_10410 [Hoyosella rhizosphaerae]